MSKTCQLQILGFPPTLCLTVLKSIKVQKRLYIKVYIPKTEAPSIYDGHTYWKPGKYVYVITTSPERGRATHILSSSGSGMHDV